VRLTFIIDTGPRVELRVRPDGILSRSTIAELIPIERLGSADQDLLEDSRARIETRLKRDGFWRAAAPFTRDLQPEAQRLTIVFDIATGPRFFVDRVELPDDLSLSPATLRDLIDIGPGDVFDEGRFIAALAQVADRYRRSGYYQVAITPSYQEAQAKTTADHVWVVLHPEITEGPRGVLTRIDFTFAGPPQIPEAELRAAMRSRVGAPFVQADAAADEVALRGLYLDRGFRTAAVSIGPALDAAGQSVALAVAVNEGGQALIGDIQVSGNQRIATAQILEEMQLAPGDPAGRGALESAQRRVMDMGVFRRASVRIDELTGESRVLVVVNVTESPNTTLAFGGGLEGRRSTRTVADNVVEDYLELSPRGSFEIGRRNLGGRNRSLSLFSRVSFNPLRRRGTPSVVEEDVTEYRVTGTYRERRAFHTDLDLLAGIVSEQGFRTNFDFVRNAANAEFLRRPTDRVNWAGRYSLSFTRLLNERFGDDSPDDGNDLNDRPVIDRLFPQVRLSVLGAGISWDRRNDPLATSRGTFVTADAEVASRSLGSEVGYIKTFLQGALFHPLDEPARTVVALRAQLGAARGFRRVVQDVDENGDPLFDEDGRPVLTTIQDLPASERFYAGGGTTVRGFQADRLGVPDILNASGLSLGGNGLVVLNAEVRRTFCQCRSLLGTNLSMVGFLDGGNVFSRARQLDIARLRGAAGLGIRYNSPLGPLRFDVGFKLSRQGSGPQRERGWEYHLSIGETF
jgi:outer membrane protein assembly factor BamA